MKYHNSKISNNYKRVIDLLSTNNNIIIMKQDKGHGVVMLDCTKCIGKCFCRLK